MASSPIVWTPDKRMILQSAVADLSPEAFQAVVSKVFGPATLAMRTITCMHRDQILPSGGNFGEVAARQSGVAKSVSPHELRRRKGVKRRMKINAGYVAIDILLSDEPSVILNSAADLGCDLGRQ